VVAAQRRPPEQASNLARTLGRVPETVAPFQGADCFRLPSGGLRCAATTGYYLTAFQAAAISGLSLLVEFPACIQIVEIQNRVEDEEVAAFGLATPHWIR
jgi:hypothetical protein